MILPTTFSDVQIRLRNLGRKQSVHGRTPHATSHSTPTRLSLPSIEATSEQDLLVSLSTLPQVQNKPIPNADVVQAVTNERPNTFPDNLPVEIFIQILKVASEVNTEKPAVYLGELSLVCRSWKAIIYNTPNLWTRIVCGDQVRRALVNSREMPLAVHIPTGEATFRWLLIALRPHAHRLQSFSASDFCYFRALFWIYPLLKAIHTLHIVGDTLHPISFLYLDRRRAPNLLRLSLDRCIIPWESDLLSGLESLIILRPAPSHSPSLEALEAVLDRCPSLKVLRIESDDKSGRDTGSLDRPRIQLTLLQELSVKRIPSLVTLPAIIEAARLTELDTTSHINPRNPMTSMESIEEVLFPPYGASAILTALHNSGARQVSLWWETDHIDDRRIVWMGNYCRRNDLRSRRPPHPVTFGLGVSLRLLEETLSLILQNLADRGFSVAVHVIRKNFTTGMFTAIDHPAVNALYVYHEDYLSSAVPYLTRLEAGGRSLLFPNLALLVAHYRLDTILESNRRAHLSGLVALYRARNAGGNHSFSMRLLDFVFDPKSGRFEEEGGCTCSDLSDLS